MHLPNSIGDYLKKAKTTTVRKWMKREKTAALFYAFGFTRSVLRVPSPIDSVSTRSSPDKVK
jgi:hypothetical protein